MRKLRLVGLSADGQHVVCVDDAGVEFALPVDDRLRAALRGDRARLGQLEIQMDSALRPRDIQARIRAGESPESVAALAGVSVDKIMPFCVPVIAERQHVAETARRSHVRRKKAEGPARRLADVVAERLRGRGVDPESAEWDAWRRDDGRWTVQASYHSGESQRSGTFAFDMAGRYSVADDDEARWLTGEKSGSHGPQPRSGRGAERRLTAVPDGDDLLSLTGEEPRSPDDLDAVMRAVQDEEEQRTEEQSSAHEAVTAPHRQPTETEDGDAGHPARPSDEPPSADEPEQEQAAAAGQSAAEPAPEAAPGTEPAPRKRRQRRASVPSWDEIMFGKGGSQE